MDHFSPFRKFARRNVFCQDWGIVTQAFFLLWVSPIFFCLDCGFMMCYGIHETTMKPDVLSNVSMRSLNNFAEVELRAHDVASVRTF